MSNANQHSPTCVIDHDHAPDKDRAKRILIEILRISKDHHIETTRRFFKAFYFAHLYFAKRNAGFLSEWPIVKMPNGPGVGSGEALLRELESEGVIAISQSCEGPFPDQSMHYRLLQTDRMTDLNGPEIDAIRIATVFANGYSPEALSQMTHDLSKSWNLAENEGDELNIYIDLMTDAEFASHADGADEISEAIKHVRGEASSR